MNFKKIHEQALVSLPSILNHILPGGKFDGANYVCLNPRRSDKKVGSFKVQLATGTFKDFSSGDGGKDIVDLVAFVFNLELKEAADKTLELLGQRLPEIKYEPKPDRYLPLEKHGPREAKQWEMTWRERGKTVKSWCYRDVNSRPLIYDVRLEKPDGSKEVLTLSWCQDTKKGSERWAFKNWTSNRPLFNLAGIDTHSDVLFVEGCKCAESALMMVGDDIAATCFAGGASALDLVDISPLNGKNIIIWPDNDEAGFNLQSKLIEKLTPIVNSIKVIEPESYRPEKWDCADFYEEIQGSKQKFKEYLRENIKTVFENYIEPDYEEFEDFQDFENFEPQTDSEPFRYLGHNRESFYYLPKAKGQIVSLSASSHNSNHLIVLAPRMYWESKFPGKQGASWSLAAEHIMYECMKKGIFHPDKIRGRGAWNDNKNTVIHLGDRMILNSGGTVDPVDYEGEYIYERALSLKSKTDGVATTQDGIKVIELCKSFPWKSEVHGVLAAGWAYLAPICGALYWRPHIWITGEAGSGKTWFRDNVLRPFVSGFGLMVQGNTTSAGLRQTLIRDALAVLFDEAESNDRKGAERIQEVLELMRQASMPGESAILKGSAGGESQSYLINSMFALVSIVTAIKQQADEGRITLLELMSWNKEVEELKGKTKKEHFKKTDEDIYDIFGRDGAEKFRNRAFKNIDTIKKNIEVFRDVCADHFGTQRSGDQIGTLLAGAFCLGRDGVVSKPVAKKWLESHDWSEQILSQKSDNDQDAALRAILQYTIRVSTDTTTLEKTIEQVIKYRLVSGGDVTGDQAKDALLKYGIKCSSFSDTSPKLLISYKHSGLDKIFKDTAWATGYHRLLLRIPGAESVTRKILKPNGKEGSNRFIQFDAGFIKFEEEEC